MKTVNQEAIWRSTEKSRAIMTIMTESQGKAAARELCRLRGIDPDSLVAHGAEPDECPAVLLYSPAWVIAKREINNMEKILAAIECGRAQL